MQNQKVFWESKYLKHQTTAAGKLHVVQQKRAYTLSNTLALISRYEGSKESGSLSKVW